MKAVTFDVYGTLVRFHQAVEQALSDILEELGSDLEMQVLRADFRATQPGLQSARPILPYRQVLSLGLERALKMHGLPWRPAFADRLIGEINAADTFAEVPEALAVVRRHARLVFISNTDEDMIRHNIARMAEPPDVLVTAQRAGSYKPDHAIFRFAWAQAGLRPEETVHVAAGFHHDIEPAHALGLRRIWVNRRGEAGDQAFGPYGELTDLAGLPAMLGVS